MIYYISTKKKYHYYLTSDKYKLVIKSLIDSKNNLIQQGCYTDAVDNILTKLLNTKKKKVRIKSA